RLAISTDEIPSLDAYFAFNPWVPKLVGRCDPDHDQAASRAIVQRMRFDVMLSNSRRFISVAFLVLLGLAASLPAAAQQVSAATSTPKKSAVPAAAAAAAATPAASALVGNISGKVVEKGGAAIPYANVIVLGTHQGTA